MASKPARAKAKGNRGDKRKPKTKGRAEIHTEQAEDGLCETQRFWKQMGEDDLAESQRKLFEEHGDAGAPSAVAAKDEASAVAAEDEAEALRRLEGEQFWRPRFAEALRRGTSAVAAKDEAEADVADAQQRFAEALAADVVAFRRWSSRKRSIAQVELEAQREESQDHDAEVEPQCEETQLDRSADEAELDRSRGFPPGGAEIVFLKCTQCPYAETCGKHTVDGKGVCTFCEYYCVRCGGHLTVSSRIEIGLREGPGGIGYVWR
jgi:hypothetical protein